MTVRMGTGILHDRKQDTQHAVRKTKVSMLGTTCTIMHARCPATACILQECTRQTQRPQQEPCKVTHIRGALLKRQCTSKVSHGMDVQARLAQRAVLCTLVCKRHCMHVSKAVSPPQPCQQPCPSAQQPCQQPGHAPQQQTAASARHKPETMSVYTISMQCVLWGAPGCTLMT